MKDWHRFIVQDDLFVFPIKHQCTYLHKDQILSNFPRLMQPQFSAKIREQMLLYLEEGSWTSPPLQDIVHTILSWLHPCWKVGWHGAIGQLCTHAINTFDTETYIQACIYTGLQIHFPEVNFQ